MYIKGVEGLCSGAQPGENSEQKMFRIDPNDKVTVTFPVIALEIGKIEVTLLAFSPVRSDSIRKTLIVQVCYF